MQILHSLEQWWQQYTYDLHLFVTEVKLRSPTLDSLALFTEF